MVTVLLEILILIKTSYCLTALISETLGTPVLQI